MVINRVGRAPYPGTVCGVVYQASARTCQFTFVCDGSMRRPREPAAWERARMVAERALAGHVEPIVERATSYHTLALGRIWGSRMIQIAQIGNHGFYTPWRPESGPARCACSALAQPAGEAGEFSAGALLPPWAC